MGYGVEWGKWSFKMIHDHHSSCVVIKFIMQGDHASCVIILHVDNLPKQRKAVLLHTALRRTVKDGRSHCFRVIGSVAGRGDQRVPYKARRRGLDVFWRFVLWLLGPPLGFPRAPETNNYRDPGFVAPT